MNILVSGINGKMISLILPYLNNYNITGFDIKKHETIKTITNIELINPLEFDLLVDFSSASLAELLIEKFLNENKKVISGTTGLNDQFIKKMKQKAKRNNTIFIHEVNYALGYKYLSKMITKLPNENTTILERHNLNKKDKPSGTAISLAKKINLDSSTIISIRNINKHPLHVITYDSGYETIVISYLISDKEALVKGFLEQFYELVGE